MRNNLHITLTHELILSEGKKLAQRRKKHDSTQTPIPQNTATQKYNKNTTNTYKKQNPTKTKSSVVPESGFPKINTFKKDTFYWSEIQFSRIKHHLLVLRLMIDF